jgi:hypothetical protein
MRSDMATRKHTWRSRSHRHAIGEGQDAGSQEIPVHV